MDGSDVMWSCCGIANYLWNICGIQILCITPLKFLVKPKIPEIW